MNVTQLDKVLNSKLMDSNYQTLILGFLAGIYISLGATLYSLVTGINLKLKYLGAILFTLGLILVIYKKAQLFTGNNLMFVSLFQKNAHWKLVLNNWIKVYFANFLGALTSVLIVHFFLGDFDLFTSNLKHITKVKTSYTFDHALIRAIFCNVLVCIAIILAITCRSLKFKLLGIIIPVSLFVYLGFEHSIANMFFIPLGLSFDKISLLEGFLLLLKNLIPVTIGNILGGFLISLIYMFKHHLYLQIDE